MKSYIKTAQAMALAGALVSTMVAMPASAHGKKKHKHGGRKASTVEEVISFDTYRQPNGTIDLLSVKSIPDQGIVFFHSRSTNDGESFSPRISINSRLKDGEELGNMRTPKRGGDYQIASHGKNILISYEIKGNNKYGSGPLRTILSRDGGLTFENYNFISNSTQGQGFVDVAATDDGQFHIVWLENHPEGRGLRHGRFDLASKSMTAVETHVDKKTCACCWNTLKAYGNDLYTVYRDKKPSDMSMAYSKDKGKTWTYAGKAGSFGWDFDGCPHVGSGLAFDAQMQPAGGVGNLERPFAHVTSWTAKEGALGLYYQNWSGAGTKWSKPFLLAKKGRRSDITVVDDLVVAVYEEMINEKMVARIRVADLTKKPLTFSSPRTISTKFTFYPRIMATKNGALMVSTQTIGKAMELVIQKLPREFLKGLTKSTPKAIKTASHGE